MAQRTRKTLFQESGSDEEEDFGHELDATSVSTEIDRIQEDEESTKEEMKKAIMEKLKELAKEVDKDAWKYKPMDKLLGI